MKLQAKVTLLFKNKDGEKKELTMTVKEMLERTLEDFYEDLEGKCTNSGCNNEAKTFAIVVQCTKIMRLRK